jgi:hypothetical protein
MKKKKMTTEPKRTKRKREPFLKFKGKMGQ